MARSLAQTVGHSCTVRCRLLTARFWHGTVLPIGSTAQCDLWHPSVPLVSRCPSATRHPPAALHLGAWCSAAPSGRRCHAANRRHGMVLPLGSIAFRRRIRRREVVLGNRPVRNRGGGGGAVRPQRGLAGTPRRPFMPSGDRRTAAAVPIGGAFFWRSPACGGGFAAGCPAATAAWTGGRRA